MTILFIAKSDQGSLTTEQVLEAFMTAENLEEIKQAVERAQERLYVSWATVDARDKQGERIPIQEVIRQQDVLLERNGPITDTHTNRVIGETLAYKVMEHPRSKTTGVLHLNKIFNHHELDHEVWRETQEGLRSGSSVGGYADPAKRSVVMEKDGKLTAVLHGFAHLETANVVSPANQWALNEAVSVVAKSLSSVKKDDALRETLYKKFEAHGKPLTQEAFDGIFKEAISEVSALPQQEVLYKNAPRIGGGGEISMTPEEINKKFDDLNKSVDERINALSTSVSKSSEDILKAIEALKPVAKESDEEEEKKVAKEEAASKIEGESDAPQLPDPNAEDSNDKEVYKSQLAEIKKSLREEILKEVSAEVKKSFTPRPGAGASPKFDNVKKMAEDLALGKIRGNWETVNKLHREANDGAVY